MPFLLKAPILTSTSWIQTLLEMFFVLCQALLHVPQNYSHTFCTQVNGPSVHELVSFWSSSWSGPADWTVHRTSWPLCWIQSNRQEALECRKVYSRCPATWYLRMVKSSLTHPHTSAHCLEWQYGGKLSIVHSAYTQRWFQSTKHITITADTDPTRLRCSWILTCCCNFFFGQLGQ